MSKIKLTFILASFVFLFAPTLIQAQGLDCTSLGANYTKKDGLCFPPDYVGSKLDDQSPGKIIATVLEVMLQFAGIVAVVFIIYGGYVLMTAAGNEENAAKGKKVLIYSLLGLVVIMLSYVIVSFITRVIVSGKIGT